MSTDQLELEPRGLRNNNPGNIRTNARYVWQHQTGADPGGFCVFDDPIYGMRAICILWSNYRDMHGCACITDYINRWAPPSENNSGMYARFIASRIGVAVDAPLDLHHDAAGLVAAIVSYENGRQPYTLTQIQRAITLSHER